MLMCLCMCVPVDALAALQRELTPDTPPAAASVQYRKSLALSLFYKVFHMQRCFEPLLALPLSSSTSPSHWLPHIIPLAPPLGSPHWLRTSPHWLLRTAIRVHVHVSLLQFYLACIVDDVSPRVKSAAVPYKRPISQGMQTYSTLPSNYPVTQPMPKLSSALQVRGQCLTHLDLVWATAMECVHSVHLGCALLMVSGVHFCG